MEEKKPLVIIGGATGVGKTAASVRLAGNIGGEIISADSMQVYKGMDIGTAKISPEETMGIPHYLIDVAEPDFDYNVFEFKKMSRQCIEDIYSRGKIPIIVGGTGFYIQSVLYDIDFSSEDEGGEYRKELEALDTDIIYERLKNIDPKSAEAIHKNNRKRVIRALEFYHNTGSLISEHNEEQRQKDSPYNYVYFILNRDRSVVYERIEKRVDKMIEEGLEAEVRGLLDSGLSKDAVSMQGLGYKEMASYINGEISLEEAIYLIKLNTRHFAKRQLTWFRREKETVWVDLDGLKDECEAADKMTEILKERGIV